jgi:hypothetical protein
METRIKGNLMKPATTIKSALTMLFVLLIASCSNSPTIHLNNLYIDEYVTQSIKESLENQGLQVKINSLEFPDDINSTSIVYSPFVQDPKALDKVEKALEILGYKLDSTNPLVSSNHWYTKNTMGLFIVPQGVIPNSGSNIIDLANHYKSEGCAVPIEIELKPNGIFKYKENGKEELKGIWSITGFPYILLEKEEPYLNYYFEVEKVIVRDQLGKINTTILKPISNHNVIHKCNLVNGVRA